MMIVLEIAFGLLCGGLAGVAVLLPLDDVIGKLQDEYGDNNLRIRSQVLTPQALSAWLRMLEKELTGQVCPYPGDAESYRQARQRYPKLSDRSAQAPRRERNYQHE